MRWEQHWHEPGQEPLRLRQHLGEAPELKRSQRPLTGLQNSQSGWIVVFGGRNILFEMGYRTRLYG